MEFEHQGSKIWLCGLQQPSLAHIIMRNIDQYNQTQMVAHYFHLTIDLVTDTKHPQ